jgi:hypothetical protein
MTKNEQLFISIGAMIGGWLLGGFAFTTPLGHPVSSISLIAGLIFSIGGFISLILAVKRPTIKRK